MNTPVLIGLNGRARSGKDTAAAYIRRCCGGSMQRVGFADKLKLSAAFVFGFDPQSVEEAVDIAERIKTSGSVVTTWQEGFRAAQGTHDSRSFGRVPNIRSKTISGRELYQRYGTEAHRDVFGRDFWVDALLPQPAHHGGPYGLQQRFPGIDFIVIVDLRFENEAERVLDLGGYVWRIDADERLGPLPANAHISEQGLPDELTCLTVDNNRDQAHFESQVESAFAIMMAAG